VGTHRHLFEFLFKEDLPPVQIAILLQRQHVPRFLTQILSQDPPLATALVRELELGELARLGTEGRLEHITLARQVSRNQESPFPTDAFVRLLARNPHLQRIIEEYGKNGLTIFFAYVNADSGTRQNQRALQALDLYRKGAPLEMCLNTELLSTTIRYYSIPMVGPSLYALLFPLHVALPWLGILLVLFIILLFLAMSYRLFFKRHISKRLQKINSQRTRKALGKHMEEIDDEPSLIEADTKSQGDGSHDRKRIQ